jgi:hypothetical protein
VCEPLVAVRAGGVLLARSVAASAVKRPLAIAALLAGCHGAPAPAADAAPKGAPPSGELREAPDAARSAPDGAPWVEDAFAAPDLAPWWTAVRAGDPRDPLAAPRDGRLALALDTLGTDPHTLKVVGVRSRAPARLRRVEWTLDWNAQANGSYLEAALYLSPQATDGDPAALPDWLRVDHVGVPPGQRWRYEVAEQRHGALSFLDQAGWPADRSGRAPGAPRARLDLGPDGRVTYAEDGVVLSSVHADVPLDRPLYVYLTLTGHSNYPKRMVFVDDVRLVGAP